MLKSFIIGLIRRLMQSWVYVCLACFGWKPKQLEWGWKASLLSYFCLSSNKGWMTTCFSIYCNLWPKQCCQYSSHPDFSPAEGVVICFVKGQWCFVFSVQLKLRKTNQPSNQSTKHPTWNWKHKQTNKPNKKLTKTKQIQARSLLFRSARSVWTIQR